MISRLPDDVTAEQIMDRLYVQLKIEKGLRQLEEGQSFSHESVKRRLKKWLA
jgi:predicted transcriptional regulator